MWLLYAGDVDGRAGSSQSGSRAGSAAHSRTSLWQLLPLHRVPGHYRCDRDDSQGTVGALVMKATNSTVLSMLDRPNSYIGKAVPRPNLDRLMQGRGLYVSA